MATTRGRALSELKSDARADLIRIDATTEDDSRRHLLEDGFDPENPLSGFREIVSARRVRVKAGLSEQAFADALGVPLATLHGWEQAGEPADPAVRALLKLVEGDPQRAFEILAR